MFIRACFYAAAVILLAMPDVRAATYSYTGNTLYGGSSPFGHLTAVVELNCSAPCAAGIYVEGSGLTSFTLAHAGIGSPIYSAGTSSPNYSNEGHVNYLTLSDSGQVVGWSLYAITAPGTFGGGYQASTRYALDGSHDSSILPFAFGAQNSRAPGSWNGEPPPPVPPVEPVPLPPAFLLFVGGLSLLGFLRSRSSATRPVTEAA
jgi:hypothetical protein